MFEFEEVEKPKKAEPKKSLHNISEFTKLQFAKCLKRPEMLCYHQNCVQESMSKNTMVVVKPGEKIPADIMDDPPNCTKSFLFQARRIGER